MTSITTQSVEDLYVLLNQEIRLELSAVAPILDSPPILPSPTVNVSARSSGTQCNRGRSSNRGFGGDCGRGTDRGRDNVNFQSPSHREVCNRQGHVALNYYHHFNF